MCREWEQRVLSFPWNRRRNWSYLRQGHIIGRLKLTDLTAKTTETLAIQDQGPRRDSIVRPSSTADKDGARNSFPSPGNSFEEFSQTTAMKRAPTTKDAPWNAVRPIDIGDRVRQTPGAISRFTAKTRASQPRPRAEIKANWAGPAGCGTNKYNEIEQKTKCRGCLLFLLSCLSVPVGCMSMNKQKWGQNGSKASLEIRAIFPLSIENHVLAASFPPRRQKLRGPCEFRND